MVKRALYQRNASLSNIHAWKKVKKNGSPVNTPADLGIKSFGIPTGFLS